MTQAQAILQYLNDFGSITPMEAFADLGITKLSSRIGDMERKGIVRTVHSDIRSTNRYGKKVKYKRYILIKEKEAKHGIPETFNES